MERKLCGMQLLYGKIGYGAEMEGVHTVSMYY